MSITDGDERKNFILATVANYFGTAVKDPAIENLRNNSQLISFLDDANSTILSTSVEKKGENFNFHMDNATNVGKANDNVLVMFKSKPEIITPTNLHTNILVNSMLQSPVSSLYHSLHKIYTPLLLKDAKWSQEFDPKLQALITELEKGLGSLMRRSEGHNSSSGGLSSILTPSDEAQFWADEANSNKKRDVRELAAAFYSALEPMKIEFEKLDSLQLNEAEEVLEIVHNSLDDLWKIGKIWIKTFHFSLIDR